MNKEGIKNKKAQIDKISFRDLPVLSRKTGQRIDFPKNKTTQLTFLGNKKAQMELSFGMIFSIILIIIFLAAAFYGIKVFLGFRDSSTVSQFYTDFNSHVDDAYKGLKTDETRNYILPSKIKKVCFLQCPLAPKTGSVTQKIYDEIKYDCGMNKNKNVFLYPRKIGSGMDSNWIKNINMTKTTSSGNPFCVDVKEGKLSLKIKKDYGENWVTIAA